MKGHLRDIRYAGESCVEELLTRMHSCLWLFDFHDLRGVSRNRVDAGSQQCTRLQYFWDTLCTFH